MQRGMFFPIGENKEIYWVNTRALSPRQKRALKCSKYNEGVIALIICLAFVVTAILGRNVTHMWSFGIISAIVAPSLYALIDSMGHKKLILEVRKDYKLSAGPNSCRFTTLVRAIGAEKVTDPLYGIAVNDYFRDCMSYENGVLSWPAGSHTERKAIAQRAARLSTDICTLQPAV